MLELAFFLGIYSYLIFVLGILGLLYKPLILIASLLYLTLTAIYFRDRMYSKLVYYTKRREEFFGGIPNLIRKHKLQSFLLFLISIQALINLIGVLGPEISFDALWYHLTLPKIYLLNHRIFDIKGDLLYYSNFPKLVEMLYISGLSFGNEIIPKLTHFLFGLASVFVVYKISKKYLDTKFSLLTSVIFYSNLVIGWESIASYIDLARTFFELLAVFCFLNWTEFRKRKWLVYSAFMLGFAISAKLISVLSLAIFLIYIMYAFLFKSNDVRNWFINSFIFTFISIGVTFPWLLITFINKGNPIYPIGVINLPKVSFFDLLRALEDPLSPVYLIFLPLVILNFKNLFKRFGFVLVYLLLGFFFWYLIIRVGGARYTLPYFALFSIVISYIIYRFSKNKRLYLFSLAIIVLTAFSSIFYRGLANAKYVPVILGKETKSEFLSKNLNFSFGDFYDVDGYFEKNIKSSDIVLLYGFHNLYYVNFPFIDSTWVKKGDLFSYIAVQNTILPPRFSDWKEIYYNKQTDVKLYSKEGKIWAY